MDGYQPPDTPRHRTAANPNRPHIGPQPFRHDVPQSTRPAQRYAAPRSRTHGRSAHPQSVDDFRRHRHHRRRRRRILDDQQERSLRSLRRRRQTHRDLQQWLAIGPRRRRKADPTSSPRRQRPVLSRARRPSVRGRNPASDLRPRGEGNSPRFPRRRLRHRRERRASGKPGRRSRSRVLRQRIDRRNHPVAAVAAAVARAVLATLPLIRRAHHQARRAKISGHRGPAGWAGHQPIE